MRSSKLIPFLTVFGLSVFASSATPTQFFDEDGAYYGPDCDETNYKGAYYTGDYTSPFTTVLGKTDEDIQKKLDQLWDHYFGGQNDKTVYLLT